MKIRIGIDPAFRKNGFGICIIDEAGEVGFKKVRSFLDFLFWLMTDAPVENVLCVVENSNLQDVLFYTHRAKSGALLTYSQAKKAYGARPLTDGEKTKAAMGVGKNMAISQCVYEACVWKWGKEAVRGLSPREKGAKWSLPYAQAIGRGMGLKLPGKVSQDDLDAFQLAVR
jgi:hypothetical protein